MTEAEWLACEYPEKLFKFVAGRLSERRFLLLCCACCRRVRHLLKPAAVRHAVDVCERFADGEVDKRVFWDAANAIGPLLKNHRAEFNSGRLRYAVLRAVEGVEMALTRVPEVAAPLAFKYFASAEEPYLKEAYAEQAHLIRDLVGNPFHAAILHPDCRCWGQGIVPRIARAIYDERAFDRLPILADALEEAGCTNPDLLGHLRGPGPHVRGCWAVDLLLGKV
jgi:hypothetical protein